MFRQSHGGSDLSCWAPWRRGFRIHGERRALWGGCFSGWTIYPGISWHLTHSLQTNTVLLCRGRPGNFPIVQISHGRGNTDRVFSTLEQHKRTSRWEEQQPKLRIQGLGGLQAPSVSKHPMVPPSHGASISAHRERWTEAITLANGVILKG